MIVDCHTHIDCPPDDAAISGHLDACEKVDACFVLTSGPDQDYQNNKAIGQYTQKHSKMIGFATFNPLVDKVARKNIAAATIELGLRGVVLYCAEDKFHPAHSKAMQFYEAAAELNLPVFFHNSAPFLRDAVMDYVQPYLLDEVARTFASLKIIIGNMGFPFVNQTLCMIAKHPNVYADLTISPQKVWEVYNIVRSAHEASVMEKLLFGSGYPFTKPDNCIETLLGFNKLLADTNLPQVPREKLRSVIERDTLSLLGIEHT